MAIIHFLCCFSCFVAYILDRQDTKKGNIMFAYVYLIRCGESDFYKIGISENPYERLAGLQKSNPYPLELLVTCQVDNKKLAIEAETNAHIKLSRYRMHGEWFKLPEDVANQLKIDMVSCATIDY